MRRVRAGSGASTSGTCCSSPRRPFPTTEGLDQAAFVADTRTYDATLRNIELIGEAATHIPAEVQKAHPGVSWHAIVGARNRLAHGYLQISDSVIWSIVEDAIPALLPELRTILDTPTGRTESGE